MALRIATAPLDTLTTFPGNARRGNVEVIKQSLARRGQYKPLVISADNVILAGNHTFMAAKQLGWKTVLVTRLPMTHDTPEAREIVIVDNRSADLGDYDNQALATLLSAINQADQAALGYTATDITDLLRLLEPPTPPPPTPPYEPKPRKHAGGTAPVTVLHGDCIAVMSTMEPDSVDAIVTDPPYGLGFMGKAWDDLPPGKDWAEACLRVLKPGGHLVAFGGTRTWHRLVVAVEDAGFEIRDSIAWLYGSGFPKSLDISKAIDKAAGAEREIVGYRKNLNRTVQRADAAAFHSSEGGMFREDRDMFADTAPATDEAREWQGWGTALKPAHEPICLARKPFKTTVADNVLEHGTGGLNIDGTRIESDREPQDYTVNRLKPGATINREGGTWRNDAEDAPTFTGSTPSGRWPANVALDEDQAAELDEQSGMSTSTQTTGRRSGKDDDTTYGRFAGQEEVVMGHDDSGGASRFFTTIRSESGRWPANVALDESQAAALDEQSGVLHNAGNLTLSAPTRGGKLQVPNVSKSPTIIYDDQGGASRFYYCAKASGAERPVALDSDGQPVMHETVKPLELVRWLVRLITPPDGTVLDTFAGSGTTLEAARAEGFPSIGIEKDAKYLPLIKARFTDPPVVMVNE